MKKYEFKQTDVWAPWAILDERGTEVCDGPHEQAKIGKILVKLINSLVALEKEVHPPITVDTRDWKDVIRTNPPTTKELFDLMIELAHEIPDKGNLIVPGHVGETLDQQVELHKARKCGCKFFTPAEIVIENRRRKAAGE